MPYEPTPEQIRATFGRDAQDFAGLAASLGWRVVFNSTGTSITLIPYNDADQRIHLSSRNKNHGGALRKRMKKLVRYADPEALARLDSFEKADVPDEVKVALHAIHYDDRITQEGVITVMQDEQREEEEPVHVVSTRPALMRRGKGGNTQMGSSYPSETTIEQTWSDGSINYACKCCGETSKNKRAFGSSHWAAHVRRGEARPVETDRQTLVKDPSYTEPAFKRGRSHRSLVHFLEQLDLASLGVDELAEMILEFLGRKGISLAPGEAQELTPEQIIERIRNLVDKGTYAKQEEEIKQRDRELDELRTEVKEVREGLGLMQFERDQMRTDLEAANARADEAEDNVATFLELAQSTLRKPEVVDP